MTLAVAAASGPPTVAIRMPSAAVTMLNSRTRSARARQASASRMCSTSAIIALELVNPLMTAFTSLAITASRSLRSTGGFGVTSKGMTTAQGAPAGRRAAASASTARMSDGSLRPPPSSRAARTSTAGLSTRSTAVSSLTGPAARSVSLPGTASTRAGALCGRLAGTGRRCRPAGRGGRTACCLTGIA